MNEQEQVGEELQEQPQQEQVVEQETPDWEAERASLIKERDEYLDQWKRSAAEFINYKRREERQRADRDRAANQRLLLKLLPLLDDFRRALQHRPEELVENEWANGILAMERRLLLVLEQENVSRIEAEPGTPFDPTVHEAISSQVREGTEPGIILEELERGYKHGDYVLRAARVVVSV